MLNGISVFLDELKGFFVYRHFLIAFDGSELSHKAIEHAVALSRPLTAKLTVLYASPPLALPLYISPENMPPATETTPSTEVAKEAADILSAARTMIEDAGLSCDAIHAPGTPPWEAILYEANRIGCDLIVMASHGRSGVSAVLLGSETQKVLIHSKIPVLVVR
ncbi:MAG: universal stress protein [Burkholderiales bacterium]|jgi:nucleotide-binding universal stress UspA family protein|nr:universal stress protein [Burkholderiales bacterium]